MKIILLLILTFFLSSCYNNFEEDYYEKVSGIKFPENYKVLETYDNGEWVTGTVLAVDISNLEKFIIENHFDTLQNVGELTLFSNSYLKKYKIDFDSTKEMFFLRQTKGKNSWTYIADLNGEKLWAEISYPDWAGD